MSSSIVHGPFLVLVFSSSAEAAQQIMLSIKLANKSTASSILFSKRPVDSVDQYVSMLEDIKKFPLVESRALECLGEDVVSLFIAGGRCSSGFLARDFPGS
jgi:hypothetical protein